MSKYSQYNKNDTYLANLNYANAQKERRNKEELKEIEQDRIAMEKLQIELNQEKQLEKERKNQIRQQQYEDYSNYFKQKYSEVPQSKENINIKLGTEQRFIRKPSYQQQMENLCLNPTRNANVYSHTPTPNFSEQGRRYQRGYSHGYNILTGEAYSPELQQGKIAQNRNVLRLQKAGSVRISKFVSMKVLVLLKAIPSRQAQSKHLRNSKDKM